MHTLLIVDDEEIEREGMAQFIPWDTYKMKVVGTARNGAEGLEKIAKYKPDLAIVDIKMPVMNDIEMIDVVNYIRHHISEPITVENMAEALFMSRPYLSRKFKEETGESLTDFILYEKTEEAKRLLRYSDKPITAISSYLGFSSPSHFSRVFKARVCLTPGEYREKHQ